ncbi:DUF4870 domain-containing protein [Evansella sp. AB-P1]|uniref:DUF4870 domain-containing protein n=1 Tax=Evansella sp. AB-P1 TaxID=3037653 RepID=UPI00241CA4A1|nr:DUF4870 domain-containing protein [Evansella sp. AB-P1]MDG5790066.1 DUF4870 domain-containing protein [Evansella sp. AB-P1]
MASSKDRQKNVNIGFKNDKEEEVHHAALVPHNERMAASTCHLLAMTPVPILNLIVTYLFWKYVRKKSSFADYHGKQSLNLLMSFTIYLGVVFGTWYLLSVINTGEGQSEFLQFMEISLGYYSIFFAIITFVYFAIIVTTATISTMKGKKDFKYPLAIQFLK